MPSPESDMHTQSSECVGGVGGEGGGMEGARACVRALSGMIVVLRTDWTYIINFLTLHTFCNACLFFK